MCCYALTLSQNNYRTERSIFPKQQIDLVLATTETLQEFREEKSWENLYDYAKSVAELRGIDIATHSHVQRARRPPRRLEDMVVLESTGSR